MNIQNMTLHYRTNKLDCPNENCPSNNNNKDDETKSSSKKICKTEKEIVYIRYDNENTIYIYVVYVTLHGKMINKIENNLKYFLYII